MFGSKHYVPILKWKRAEQEALRGLNETQKRFITPLIQFVMPKSKPQDQLSDIVKKFEELSKEIPEKIREIWGSSPIFADVSLLYTTPLKTKSLASILRKSHKLGAALIPVIHVNDDQQIKNTAYLLAKENNSGLCLRLICPDFSNLTKLNQDISNVLSACGLKEQDIDVLVDIKETEGNGTKYSKYLGLSQNILNISKWRSFIFASGSFPEDLTDFKIDEENLVPRVDWKSWNEHIMGNKLRRNPAFSDYAIQYPIYKELTQFFHPTSSIKYTLENEWLIMKGRKQEFELYLASAAELIKDQRFYGEDFSPGDRYIAEKARHFPVYIKDPNVKGTGNTEMWLRAGINHHLVVVANQIASLP